MLLERPLSIGSLAIPNRLVFPPMQSGKTEHGHVTDEMVSHYRERALGSRPGLIIVEHCYVDPDGRANDSQLSFASDDLIPGHQRIADAIHSGGCGAFVQLSHAGSFGIGRSVSASDIKNPLSKLDIHPRPLTAGEIHRIEELYAEAAVRAAGAGYDGVELHCAHGYLLDQFYSPMTNRRTDEYGGSLENRLRFTLETIALIRKALGSDLLLAVRLGGSDYLQGGNSEEDAVEASLLLERAGIDLLDISGGMCFFARPGHTEPGYFSSMTEKIKAAVSVPVILTGGITRPGDAERMLAEGKADLIGVGRAMVKDPLWGAKR